MENLHVIKYGGTSVGDTEKIKSIAKQLLKRKSNGENLVVVISAMGQTTDTLVNLAQSLSSEPCSREMDLLLSTGEQVSMSLLSMSIKNLGGQAVSYTGQQAGIFTDNTHSRARIRHIKTEKITSALADGNIVIVAGFQGVTEDGEITTLGRGGSDTSAVCLAASLKCSCEIYTDVDGVYATDPRIFPNAKKISMLCYNEMLEMASLGAKILETRAVEMAQKFNVPLTVAHYSGTTPGTCIKERDYNMEKRVVTGIAFEEDCLMVSLNRIPFEGKNITDIFARLASQSIFVDMISQTAPYNSFVNVSFSTYKSEKHRIHEVIQNLKKDYPTLDYLIDESIIKLSVVGIGMISQTGVAASLFQILSDNHIPFYQVTTSEISISYTIDSQDKARAATLIAESFNLSNSEE